MVPEKLEDSSDSEPLLLELLLKEDEEGDFRAGGQTLAAAAVLKCRRNITPGSVSPIRGTDMHGEEDLRFFEERTGIGEGRDLCFKSMLKSVGITVGIFLGGVFFWRERGRCCQGDAAAGL